MKTTAKMMVEINPALLASAQAQYRRVKGIEPYVEFVVEKALETWIDHAVKLKDGELIPRCQRRIP